MVLRNLVPVNGKTSVDIFIKEGTIRTIGKVGAPGGSELFFDNAVVFPGLINSHDHLDFNLFPKLGNGKYSNYVDWGNDIQVRYKQTIDAVLKIPLALRTQWGVYKNLLSGVTTVVNHGAKLAVQNELIHVFQECYNLHSVRLEKNWKYKLNNPFARKWPFVVHTGEGSDDSSRREINTLIKGNIFNRRLIAVHGIAMNERQAESFKGLVWCPDSNFFLIGNTAPVNKLSGRTRVIFGTDSTLSASWNIWEHLRLARATNLLTDEELYRTITTQPATVWDLKKRGQIRETYDADLVVAKQKGNKEMYDSFYALDPADILLVLRRGEIKLFDASILAQLSKGNNFMDSFSKISVGGATKYVYGDLPGLMAEVKTFYPGAVFPVEASK